MVKVVIPGAVIRLALIYQCDNQPTFRCAAGANGWFRGAELGMTVPCPKTLRVKIRGRARTWTIYNAEVSPALFYPVTGGRIRHGPG